jgi:hypothetical protein
VANPFSLPLSSRMFPIRRTGLLVPAASTQHDRLGRVRFNGARLEHKLQGPFSEFETITLAPGMTPPEESVTLPTMVAVSCAQAEKQKRSANATSKCGVFTASLLFRKWT